MVEECIDCISVVGYVLLNERSGIEIKPCDSELRVLENMEYSFIAITPSSTLIQSGCTF